MEREREIERERKREKEGERERETKRERDMWLICTPPPQSLKLILSPCLSSFVSSKKFMVKT